MQDVDMQVYMHVHVCVLVSTPKLSITSGKIWTPYCRLNKFYSFYIAAIVGVVIGHALRIIVRCSNQPNKSKLVLYNLLLSCLTALTGLALFAGPKWDREHHKLND